MTYKELKQIFRKPKDTDPITDILITINDEKYTFCLIENFLLDKENETLSLELQNSNGLYEMETFSIYDISSVEEI